MPTLLYFWVLVSESLSYFAAHFKCLFALMCPGGAAVLILLRCVLFVVGTVLKPLDDNKELLLGVGVCRSAVLSSRGLC